VKLQGPALRLTVFVGETDQWFIPRLDELVEEVLVIIDPVEVIRYVGREAR
jgi:hypothetical protein